MNYTTGNLYRDNIYNDIFVLIAMRGENVHFYNIRTGSKHRYVLGYLHLNFISL